jgi:hypothetical protein
VLKILLAIAVGYLGVGVFMNFVVPYQDLDCRCVGVCVPCLSTQNRTYNISEMATTSFWQDALFWPKNLIEYGNELMQKDANKKNANY